MNDENLIPYNKRSEKEARENGRKGGIKSGETRRRKKAFKELFDIALNMKDEETGKKNDVTIVSAMIRKAKSGDVKAFESIRDTVGEKPIEKQEISADLIKKVFVTKEDIEKVNKIIDDVLNE